MKKHIRVLAFIIALFLLCSMFSACREKTPSDTTNSSISDTSSQGVNTSSNTDSETSSIEEVSSKDDVSSKQETTDSSKTETSSEEVSSNGDTSSTTQTDVTSSEVKDDKKEEEKVTIVDNHSGKERVITVDLNNVVNDGFVGMGGNIVPFNYMPSNTAHGYNEAYYALDAQRIKTMDIDIVRLWMQVDWFEKEKGVYDFNTPEMWSACKYIEACKAAGCDIQLTFSWKVGPDAQSWYSIPGLESANISAPADIDHYGEECAELIKYLRVTKGYDNVKHLTFANEPNGGWDFECYGDQTAYYTEMLIAVNKSLKDYGLRKDIKIWACELAGFDTLSWLSYMAKEADDCIDCWSCHDYYVMSGTLSGIIEQVNGYSKKPFFLSEFGEGNNDGVKVTSWDRGFTGMFIDGTQNGMGGLLNWCVFGVRSMSTTDADAWEMDPYENRRQMVWSNHFTKTNIPGMPAYHYYYTGMLCKYTDQGSKVVKTDVTLSNSDVRSSVFKNPDGTISVVVECKKSDAERELTVDFGENIGKTFTRHIYKESEYNDQFHYSSAKDEYKEFPDVVTKINQNSILPLADGTFKCDSTFTDKDIPKDYCVIVYTTMPTEAQIAFKEYDDSFSTSVGAVVDAGASYQVEAYVLDGKSGDEIVYSIANPGEAKQGTITTSGYYTADTNAVPGEVVAIRAAIKGDTDNYKIFLIQITPKA